MKNNHIYLFCIFSCIGLVSISAEETSDSKDSRKYEKKFSYEITRTREVTEEVPKFDWSTIISEADLKKLIVDIESAMEALDLIVDPDSEESQEIISRSQELLFRLLDYRFRGGMLEAMKEGFGSAKGLEKVRGMQSMLASLHTQMI